MAMLDQFIHKMRPDETGAACNQTTHWIGSRCAALSQHAECRIGLIQPGDLPAPLDSRVALDYQSAHMIEPAKIYFLVFGVVTIAGGIMGYVKAGSVVSVVAGAITGALLIVAGMILPTHREIGLVLGLFTSALLAAQFIPRMLRTRRLMPAGVMSVLSVIGIIIAIFSWIGK